MTNSLITGVPADSGIVSLGRRLLCGKLAPKCHNFHPGVGGVVRRLVSSNFRQPQMRHEATLWQPAAGCHDGWRSVRVIGDVLSYRKWVWKNRKWMNKLEHRVPPWIHPTQMHITIHRLTEPANKWVDMIYQAKKRFSQTANTWVHVWMLVQVYTNVLSEI